MRTLSVRFAALSLSIGLAFAFCNTVHAQAYELSPSWSIPVGTPGYEWISTNHTQRSLAYNATTGHLLTVSRYPATNAAVYLLNSTNGAHLGNLSVSNVFAEINFPLNIVDVADDGVIYACNLTVDVSLEAIGNNGPFRIYRWANESAQPTIAYVGDPGEGDLLAANRRFGDCFDVRGSGAGTEIMVGSRSGTNVTRFISADGINYTHQKINAADLTARINTMSIAFGAGNTFWTKAQSTITTNYPLQHFSYDPNTTNATLLKNYTNGVPVGGPLGFDVSRNLLGTVDTIGHSLRLYKLTASGFLQQDITRSFGATTNGNNTGAVVFTGDKLFALESNNGLMAFNITTNFLTPFTASVAAQTGQVTLDWPSTVGFVYQVLYKETLTQPSWSNLGAATNGTGSTISVSDQTGASAKFYRILAQ